VPRSPAENERAEDRSDGAQRLARAILLVMLRPRCSSNALHLLRAALYMQQPAARVEHLANYRTGTELVRFCFGVTVNLNLLVGCGI